MNNYPKEVMEVHQAFQTASKPRMNQMQVVLASKEYKMWLKAKMLREAGFTDAKGTENWRDKENLSEGEMSYQEAFCLSRYQIRYPNHRFISQEQVELICKKYNLFFGDICRYKGFVPDKNLFELEMFRIDKEDVGFEEVSMMEHRSYYGEITYDKVKDNGALIRRLSWWRKGDVRAGKKICAPIKDMDLGYKGYKKMFDEEVKLEAIDQNDMFQEGIKKIVPDPVVLQPVRYGFLIITAWGDESSDEIIVNHLEN